MKQQSGSALSTALVGNNFISLTSESAGYRSDRKSSRSLHDTSIFHASFRRAIASDIVTKQRSGDFGTTPRCAIRYSDLRLNRSFTVCAVGKTAQTGNEWLFTGGEESPRSSPQPPLNNCAARKRLRWKLVLAAASLPGGTRLLFAGHVKTWCSSPV